MTTAATQRFMSAVNELEASGDAEPLLACFGPAATLSNLVSVEQGVEGARRFWAAYRHQFSAIRSAFSDVIEDGDRAVLVWTATGTLAKGQPIAYRGTSILTWRDDRVIRFDTIYDSAAFLREPAVT